MVRVRQCDSPISHTICLGMTRGTQRNDLCSDTVETRHRPSSRTRYVLSGRGADEVV